MDSVEALASASRKQPRTLHAGFSLIELLVVVAIILIIAAIALPNLMRSRMSANEASATQSVRTVTSGEVAYSSACPDIGYSASLQELNTGALCASGKNIIDDVLGASDPSYKGGYQFTYSVTGSNGINTVFTVVSLPIAPGVSGNRGFLSDQSGVIRYTLNATAPTITSSALQ
jgi:prepilin-type N-terminal cleavage/methylation domain-containing protein